MLRCPAASVMLARQWVSYAFRDVIECRRWSWLIKRGQFLPNQVVNSGYVNVTRGSTAVVGVGTTWTQDLVGRQFRVGFAPIYTVIQVVNATTLVLDQPFGGPTATSAVYRIYNVYYTVPTDFHAFVTLWDPNYNWRLYLNVTQDEINQIDAQRSNTGTPYVVASYAYTTLTTQGVPPLPQYELWPHQLSNYVYPFMYETRPPDLDDPGASLPRYIRGDMLLEMALAQCARWPGPDVDHPNPYFNLQLAQQHEAKGQKILFDLERQDDEVYENQVEYQTMLTLPFASLPLGDAHWLQSHSI